MITVRLIICSLLVFCLSATCVERIAPESLVFEDILVVEAQLTNQFKRHEVVLSRTFELDKDTIRPELGATVWIQRSDGTSYGFIELGNGKYISENSFAATIDATYKLSIQTRDGHEYISTDEMLLPSTPIGDITVVFEPDEVEGEGIFKFGVNVSDSEGGPGFYRWDWTESYQVQVPKPSAMEWDGVNLNRREDPRELQICYADDSSSSILVAGSSLTGGGIKDFQIHSFHSNSQKLALRYSIEVRQFALNESSFRFWELIRSSGEDQGSLFDEQPGTIVGNMRSLSGTKNRVLGIFDVSQVTTLRKFYSRDDFAEMGYIPESWDIVNCRLEEPVSLKSMDQVAGFMNAYGDRYVPWYISSGLVDPPGILFTTKRCGDCREHGSNERPEFWMD